MTDNIFQYCEKAYNDAYGFAYQEFLHGKKRKQKIEEVERYAQKAAIRGALKNGVAHFPSSDVSDIWKNVYKVHIYRKSGLTVDEDTVAKVISAEQSWRKSSGHAFEELVKELANLSLSGTNVEVVLQRDLSTLLKIGEIANEPRDIAWLEKQIEAAIFDLYAIVKVENKKFCFGCIQSKTSIRDRVTRDREPSIHAMQSFFWSVCIALDGDFLKLPKFIGMVNGGTEEFPENGWHGMYVLSDITSKDRLYRTGFDLDLFTSHAVDASEYWLTQRQWFNREWKAKKD
ncbi:MAG: BsaWI family type II restriction enzyme [Bacteroides sp.]|nr:BsaWI family type II restriction enzyme [Bacteroides sp.]MCM1532108.1 BsaWI family type II restriction enzyme [Ruminococcus flavefaciens]MCM1555267.1 BsaWI family type II restriction enzyme [Bacteroides sp.]